ncbi:MAG TPA: hypothetical protein VGN63_19625 [Flavisolibacter sp.]|jgi:hypothetical protein|nr:hypothetical protein [Flavisolibacter sp.]
MATIFLFSCSKKDAIPPKPVTISSISFQAENLATNQLTVGVGQLLVFGSSISDSTRSVQYEWTITPSPDMSLVKGASSKDLNWTTSNRGPYTVKLGTTDESGNRDEKSINVNVIKSDIRNALWGDSGFTVALNEANNKSTPISITATQSIFQVTGPSYFNGWYNNKSEPGDVIGYNFTNGKLVSVAVLYDREYTINEYQKYYTDYQTYQNTKMLEYSKIREDAIWLNTQLANQYKANPNRWGEAIVLGLVKFQTLYETDRSKIVLSIYSGSGDVIFASAYLPK